MTMADLLYQHRVSAYHATNLLDLATYLELRAIPSREVLSARPFTRFFSDDRDVELGVWDSTFANLANLGNPFWFKSDWNVPNAFGPITLVLNPALWLAYNRFIVRDYSVTNKRARELEEHEVAAVLKPSGADGRHFVNAKDGKSYEVEFPINRVELSADVLAYLLVDPLVYEGVALVEAVKARAADTAWLGESRVIACKVSDQGASARMALLVRWAAELGGRLLDNYEDLAETVPAELADWYHALSSGRQRGLASWLTYTFNGTLSQLARVP